MNRVLRVLLYLAIFSMAALPFTFMFCGFTENFQNTALSGSFTSSNQKLGEWTLTPSQCLAGRELGFQGIAFLFGAGEPVEDIRIDTARWGDNIVEVRLADRSGTTYRVREAECKVIEGTIVKKNVSLNGRPMHRLNGDINFECPDHGLSGKASFSGCLPETL